MFPFIRWALLVPKRLANLNLILEIWESSRPRGRCSSLIPWAFALRKKPDFLSTEKDNFLSRWGAGLTPKSRSGKGQVCVSAFRQAKQTVAKGRFDNRPALQQTFKGDC